MSQRQDRGRALFYTRDSGGRHEMTPAEYVGWARRQAEELGLTFDGTAEALQAMIRDGQDRRGDLFLDYGVSGNLLSRNGLNALLKEALADPSVSHVLIPRRDRLARPDDPVDAVKLESVLRKSGITLVFMDRVCQPLKKGQRGDIGELIVTLVDYEKSGKDRRELAQKMIYAQIQLARRGFSVGGRAPYGFCRWLAREDGIAVRQLADGERVRMPGHHVVWLPGPEEEIAVIRRILQMLETMPATRVAATLTREGVPTPDCGRSRTDRGVKHGTSGVWHQSVIQGIARNPLLSALATYGRRSMGDQVRFTPSGPRTLQEEDYRPDGQPKVVRNPESSLIRQVVPVKFEPITDQERQAKLVAVLDARSGSQRGKPRSQDPARNPLGCRVFDMNCCWPMYRTPYQQSFRYTCGLYQQSHGQKCAHNHVEGPTAVRFLLACLRQRVLAPGLLSKLEGRLLQLAERETSPDGPAQELASKKAQLVELAGQLKRAKRNLALAATDEQFRAVAEVQKELQEQHAALEGAIKALQQGRGGALDPKDEVAKALALLGRLTELAGDEGNYASVGEVFRQLNVRLFLRFGEEQVKKRKLHKLVSGVVTFGSAAPPIRPYEGPTGRRMIKDPAASVAAGSGDSGVTSQPGFTGREGDSLGNVGRRSPRLSRKGRCNKELHQPLRLSFSARRWRFCSRKL
jgi:DNA invertase Pin-like site-specific DNA recombinase